ncbi:MAG: type II secretion system protein [Patescibacteria group bacterium]
MNNYRKRAGGFTLIELLIVIAIIGSLAAAVLVAVDPVGIFRDSRDSRRFSDMRSIDDAIRLYIVDNMHAPYLQGQCSPSAADQNCFTNETVGAPHAWSDLELDLAPYLAELPRDPCGERCFDDTANPIKFFTYNYYAPAVYAAACAGGGCGVDETSGSNVQWYALYAENLETQSGTFGYGRNPFGSY